MQTPIIAHPFLLAVFPVLFLYSHNIGETSLGETVFPLGILVLSALLMWSLLGRVLKDRQRAGLLVSVFFLLFFSFGHLHNQLAGSSLLVPFYVLWPALFLLGGYFSLKTRWRLKGVTGFLNVVAMVLVVISLVNIGAFYLKEERSAETIKDIEGLLEWEQESGQMGKFPDIYFIVLDAYGREDVLKEIYDYDNAEFLDYLSAKGFYVADEAIANYNQTGLAFSSILNLQYLDSLVTMIGEGNTNRRLLKTAIKDSLLFRFLKKRGYQIGAFASAFGNVVTDIDTADLYISPGWSLQNFHNEFLNTTPIPFVINLFGGLQTKDQADLFRKRIFFVLNNLGKITELKSPFFIFAHIEIPHPPFVFGPDGEKMSYEKIFNDNDADWLIGKRRLTFSQYLKAYRDQAIFISRRIRETIDEILSNSEKPPVIVLMSDHGPRSLMSWDGSQMSYVKESMTVLNALYLPGGEEGLYEGISLVNNFRVVLNRYFGTDLPLLEDKSFYSTAKYPFRFQDVTKRVRVPNKLLLDLRFGRAFALEGKFREALVHLEKVLAKMPDSFPVQSQVGSIYYQIGNYEKARQHFSEAVRIKPEDQQVKDNLENTLNKLKEKRDVVVD